MLGASLLDMVITTVSVLVSMALLSCLCCLCMKISDLKLKCYIVEMAKKKGIKVDLEELERKPPDRLSPLANQSCTIMVPEDAGRFRPSALEFSGGDLCSVVHNY